MTSPIGMPIIMNSVFHMACRKYGSFAILMKLSIPLNFGAARPFQLVNEA